MTRNKKARMSESRGGESSSKNQERKDGFYEARGRGCFAKDRKIKQGVFEKEKVSGKKTYGLITEVHQLVEASFRNRPQLFEDQRLPNVEGPPRASTGRQANTRCLENGVTKKVGSMDALSRLKPIARTREKTA